MVELASIYYAKWQAYSRQNGKHILGKKARVMLVRMVSIFPGSVGSVGYANRIAWLALTLAPVLAVLAVPTMLHGLR